MRFLFKLSGVMFVAALAVSLRAEELTPVTLPAPRIKGGKPLMEALKERKTTRSFSSKPLPPRVLSNLLWAAFGINRPGSGKRTAPTAVNWQEIDIYVALPGGLYLYNAGENRLDPVMAKDIRAATGVQKFTREAPVNLIYVSDHSRMKAKKADKEFYSATDAGFISQNVYLFCSSEGLATVVLGWVDKPALEKIMKLGPNRHVILTQPVGYPSD